MKIHRGFISVCLLFFALKAHSETLTLETYYPSPVGVYSNLTVTSTTVLAKNGGGVNIGKPSTPSDVSVSGKITAGDVMVPGSFAADPAAVTQLVEGAIYYNTSTKTHRVYKNGIWQDISSGMKAGTWAGSCTQNTGCAGPTCSDAFAPAKCTAATLVPCSSTKGPSSSYTSSCFCESGYHLFSYATISSGFGHIYVCVKD
ncbi:MAG: hypothetical protein PHV33_07505 [Elusimicrobiales bacterium]|nr:hypothetical protein [Elusimicrobiales bacterium]